MTKDLLSSVIYLNTAYEVWTALKNRPSQGNGPRVFELQRMVRNLHTKFKIVWDELVNYKSIPSCSCGVCTCGFETTFAQYQEEECTISFLMGLNEIFATVRGQILLMEPLPSLNKVFSLAKKVKEGLVLTLLLLRLLLLSSQKLLMVQTKAITLVSLMPRKIDQSIHIVV